MSANIRGISVVYHSFDHPHDPIGCLDLRPSTLLQYNIVSPNLFQNIIRDFRVQSRHEKSDAANIDADKSEGTLELLNE